MNAFQPKVSLLVKLAELCNILRSDIASSVLPNTGISLLNDSEVLEWLDRMAELEYIPKHKIKLPECGSGIAPVIINELLVEMAINGDIEIVAKEDPPALPLD